MNPYDEEAVDELPAPPRKTIPAADRELLELAARAIGARFEEVDGEGYGNLHFEDGSTVYAWNPFVHSDDAFNLQVRLRFGVTVFGADVRVDYGQGKSLYENGGSDLYAATRRAVTRAAAEIGKQRA